MVITYSNDENNFLINGNYRIIVHCSCFCFIEIMIHIIHYIKYRKKAKDKFKKKNEVIWNFPFIETNK